MAEHKRQVFISYSQHDQAIADRTKRALSENPFLADNLQVWIDRRFINVGDNISSSILSGLNQSDYFVLLISENSNKSAWVKREIATAFELSNKKQLSVVPILLAKTEVPFEFRGLLYIDASRSLEDGLTKLTEFFRAQLSSIKSLEPRVMMRKSVDATSAWRACQDKLRELKLCDLRFELSRRLTIADVKVLWFDVFSTRMDDEVQVQNANVSLYCVELIARSWREGVIPDLVDMICRNHPRFSYSLP